MAQISFEESNLLENFERLFRHETSDNIILTKSYDMRNYIMDFSNLYAINFINSELVKIINSQAKPVEAVTVPVIGPAVAGPAVTGAVAVPVTGPSPISLDVTKINLDSPKVKLIKKIQSELLNTRDSYIIDKYIIIFMRQLIIKPFKNYEDCDSKTIIEIISLLIPISQHDSIVTKKDKINEMINKSPIEEKEINDYLDTIKDNTDLISGIKPISETNIHFIWQKTISIIKPFFDKFRASTSPLIIRGGNVITLDQIKSKIREKVENIIPKKSLDY